MQFFSNGTSASKADFDPPITIRALYEIAHREGWDLDTRLSVRDSETLDEHVVRGLAFVPGTHGGGCIELDVVHTDDWRGPVYEVNFAFNDRVREVAEVLASEFLDASGGRVNALENMIVHALRPAMLHAFEHVCQGIGSDVAYRHLGDDEAAA